MFPQQSLQCGCSSSGLSQKHTVVQLQRGVQNIGGESIGDGSHALRAPCAVLEVVQPPVEMCERKRGYEVLACRTRVMLTNELGAPRVWVCQHVHL